ncbi:hypothetical protein L833_3581 [Mycobacteroides abscessus MAB_091912_2446]|uniref:Uncharacterized protein n=1 Tax=Mycobacteroides abscessus MAB_091912_2446 TaxID=1335414 RepID=A0A829MBC4_9MYCO|nr:hypothetical protein L833_3581 [Mycobacteroides abscessus MAB_091912_2446]
MCPGPADQYPVEIGGHRIGVCQPRVVIAPHRRVHAELAQILDQVEYEAVVVIDDQDAHRSRVRTRASRFPAG